MEDIYTYIETLQRLANLAWLFMDYHAKEEMVVDQFLITTSLVCKWLPMGTDIWRIFSVWLHRWRLFKRMKSFVPEDTNPAHKHVSRVIIRLIPSNW